MSSNPFYVRRKRTRDSSQRNALYGESQVGQERYSKTFPTRARAEREAAAWAGTGDYAATVHEGRAPRTRNPSGVRVVYSRLLGGWYIVRGPHQTPISGRFDSRAAALAWLRARNPAPRRPRKFTAFCGKCYSGGPPLETDSIRAAERWATGHAGMYPGHDTHINRHNPADLAALRKAMLRTEARYDQVEQATRYDDRGSARVRRSKASGDRDRSQRNYTAALRRGDNPRRRRNPIAKGEMIDLVIPVVALFLLVKSGRLKLGG